MERQRHLGGERPKIAALLGRAAAHSAREELALALRLQVPPSQLRGRPVTTRHTYDEEGRLASTVTASPWTTEDRALMLAYRQYLDTLCPSCGFPKDRAHHPDNDGWFEVDEAATVVCWPCTAIAKAGNDDAPETEFLSVAYVRDETTHPLPTANLQRRARSRRGGGRR